MNREQVAILDHTLHRAAMGVYCGDSPDMQALVGMGFMERAGRKKSVPDDFFRITSEGRKASEQEDAKQ